MYILCMKKVLLQVGDSCVLPTVSKDLILCIKPNICNELDKVTFHVLFSFSCTCTAIFVIVVLIKDEYKVPC